MDVVPFEVNELHPLLLQNNIWPGNSGAVLRTHSLQHSMDHPRQVKWLGYSRMVRQTPPLLGKLHQAGQRTEKPFNILCNSWSASGSPGHCCTSACPAPSHANTACSCPAYSEPHLSHGARDWISSPGALCTQISSPTPDVNGELLCKSGTWQRGNRHRQS